MGTKERETPVQDTVSGARFNLPDPKAGARHRQKRRKSN